MLWLNDDIQYGCFMQYAQVVGDLLCIAEGASKVILSHYKNDDLHIDYKADSSPVTEADIAAHNYIEAKLNLLTPNIPIISEEGANRQSSDVFWLIDPIDGTRGFIARNGEFTVNIALIEANRPIGGVIHQPTTNKYYYVGEDTYAYKKEPGKGTQKISTREISEDTSLIVATSRSVKSQFFHDYISELGEVEKIVKISSSLKFCMVAEGAADIYPRFGTTMEWDTAAGHAILNAAGGSIHTANGGKFLYGKEGFKNPHFIARS